MLFVRRHWFLLALSAVLLVGMIWNARLSVPLSQVPRGWLVAGVMFMTALPLPFTAFTSVVRRWRGLAIALVINMAMAPVLAQLLRGLLPEQLSVGLLIAASVPCTLASAAVWTRRGGGNDALALAVTIITNLSCFAVMPATLFLFLSAHVVLPKTAAELSLQLVQRVLLPIAAAQLLRVLGPVATWATATKPVLSTICQCGILTMVLLGAVGAGETLAKIGSLALPWCCWPLLIAIVAVLHLGLFAAGWWFSQSIGLARPDGVAVAVAGSQKTLMIGLDVALSFGGLAVLPMVAYHVCQLLLDTILVDWLRKKT